MSLLPQFMCLTWIIRYVFQQIFVSLNIHLLVFLCVIPIAPPFVIIIDCCCCLPLAAVGESIVYDLTLDYLTKCSSLQAYIKPYILMYIWMYVRLFICKYLFVYKCIALWFHNCSHIHTYVYKCVWRYK